MSNFIPYTEGMAKAMKPAQKAPPANNTEIYVGYVVNKENEKRRVPNLPRRMFLVIIDEDGYELLRPWWQNLDGVSRWGWVCISGSTPGWMREQAKLRMLDICQIDRDHPRFKAVLHLMPRDCLEALKRLR